MEFSCNSKILSQIVNNVCLAINKKINPMPILDGILLECTSNTLKLTAFDLNLAIIKKLNVQTIQEGRIVLNAQLFSDILRKINNTTISIKSDTNLKVTITNKETNFQITGINADQFPKIFNLENSKNFNISNTTLKNMIFQTLFAVAPSSTSNPVLCGSLFKINNENLQLISLDGYRVAVTQKKLNNLNLNSNFIISSKTLNEIFKLLTENENSEEIQINFNSKYASFNINGYNILTRLLEGNFLDYKNAILEKYETILTVNTKQLIESIERVSVVITTNISVTLQIENSKIKLNCQSTLGNANDTIITKVEGSPIEKIAFNSKYMLDALKHTQCENIKIYFNGPLNPIKITPEKNDDFIFLVLPIRI